MRFIGCFGLTAFLLAGCIDDLKDDTNPDSIVDSDVTVDTGTFVDKDGDSYGVGDDCNDHNAAINPAADELCDDTDNDCDGSIDEDDATDAPTWYADADGDGHGIAEDTVAACDAPHGYVTSGGDCDDTDATFHPGAIENDCTDANDYNCDGSVGYADADADGHAACEDCDDADPNTNVDADEICDGLDNDCDGDIDDDPVDPTTFYADADSDGYGGTWLTEDACEQPAGFVTTANDCDDLDGDSYPGGTEVCDEADNDCDGEIDEGVGVTFYADVDGDGYGDASSTTESCNMPAGYSANGNDCDDTDPSAHPGSFEICDATDNDCDGNIDESDAINATTWYADTDGDGYGDASSPTTACDMPTGHAANSQDCNDTEPAISPAASESCDSVDNDCDGSVDEDDAINMTTWYADNDSDGYGDPYNSTSTCDMPTGYASNSQDCNDVDPAVSPAANESCDSVDNDCDGTVDEDDAINASTWYADADSDGYGDPSSTTQACALPNQYVGNSDDCNDDPSSGGADQNPGLSETWYDGVDQNCDGNDNDQDGDATVVSDDCDDTDASSTIVATDADCDTVLTNDDCDDTNASSTTVATDADCDGTLTADDCDDIDPSSTVVSTDADCDGTLTADDCDDNNPNSTIHATDADCDGSLTGNDCDDSNDQVYPGQTEVCGDGVDNDCDGADDSCPCTVNPSGTTLISTSEFCDPNPPSGWTQCAGWTNTTGNDVSNSVLDGCLNSSNRLRIRAWDSNGVLEEDVYSTTADISQWRTWDYLGGSVTRQTATFWTGTTTYFTTTGGGSACYHNGGGQDAPPGTLTLGTGNGSTIILAPGHTNEYEYRINCQGSALPGRSIALYK